MNRFIYSFMISAGLFSQVSSASFTWTNGSGDFQFDNPKNYSPEGVPGSSDTVVMSRDSINKIVVDTGKLLNFRNLIVERNARLTINGDGTVSVNQISAAEQAELNDQTTSITVASIVGVITSAVIIGTLNPPTTSTTLQGTKATIGNVNASNKILNVQDSNVTLTGAVKAKTINVTGSEQATKLTVALDESITNIGQLNSDTATLKFYPRDTVTRRSTPHERWIRNPDGTFSSINVNDIISEFSGQVFAKNSTMEIADGLEMDVTNLTTQGSFQKIGAGTLQLNGSSNSLSKIVIHIGPFTLAKRAKANVQKVTVDEEGSLSVEGKMRTSETMNLYGGLTGDGELDFTAGELQVKRRARRTLAGFIQAGNSPSGTLKIAGNVNVEDGGLILGETNGTTMNNLWVQGNLKLASGAGMELLIDRPSNMEDWAAFLENGATLPFLEATTVTGSLPVPESPYPGFEVGLIRSGNNFSLDLTPLPLASLVSNRNEQAIAEIMDADHAGENADFIYANSELYFLQVPQLQEALDQLHPALFNNIALAQEETTSYVTKILSQRLEEITWKNPDKKDRSWEIWAQGLRDYARQKGTHTLPGYTATTPGVIAGADVKIDNQFALGFHGAYTNSHIDWEKKRAHGHTTTGYGGLYGSWYNQNFLVGLSLLGGWNSSKATRSILFGEIDRNAHHRVHGWEIAPQLELGGLWEWDAISLEPFIKENYIYLHQNHYRERGAESLDLSVHAKNADLLRSELGLGLFHCFQGKQLQFTPELKLSYIYESRFQGKNTKAYFLNGTEETFSVKGLSPSRSLGHLGALLKGSSYNGFDLTLDYNFLFGKEYRDHKMAIRLDYAF